jgi:hypothetical protein
MIKIINLHTITIDAGTQSREHISQETVNEYAEALSDGVVFPAIKVHTDGVKNYLTDGFHRYFAHKRVGKTSIQADVIHGTLREAILFSLSVNAEHGLKRTNADKRKAVLTILDDFEWSDWSNVDIAKVCSVSSMYVGIVKKSLLKPVKVEIKKAKKQVEKVEPSDKEQDAIDFLSQENEKLLDKLAIQSMEVSEEDKAMAKETIESLREEIKLLKIELASVKISRDGFQSENNQMKKQIAMLQKKLKA